MKLISYKQVLNFLRADFGKEATGKVVEPATSKEIAPVAPPPKEKPVEVSPPMKVPYRVRMRMAPQLHIMEMTVLATSPQEANKEAMRSDDMVANPILRHVKSWRVGEPEPVLDYEWTKDPVEALVRQLEEKDRRIENLERTVAALKRSRTVTVGAGGSASPTGPQGR